MKSFAAALAVALAAGASAAQAQTYDAPSLPARPGQEVAGAACGCPPVAVGPAPVVSYRPVVPVANGLYVGRGAWGQATVYIPGQPVRNFFRAITW